MSERLIRHPLFRGRKGFFFTVDAFVAIIVIVVGIGMLLYFRSGSRYIPPAERISEDITKVLSSGEIYEINSPLLDSLKSDGNITNIHNTVMEQVGEFYYRSLNGCSFCLGLARDVVENITTDAIPPQYSFELTIENTTLYKRELSPKEDAYALFIDNRIVSGFYNFKLWGPYFIEVTVWQA